MNLYTIGSILVDFRRRTKCAAILHHTRDFIRMGEGRFMFVIEAKMASTMKQCALVMTEISMEV